MQYLNVQRPILKTNHKQMSTDMRQGALTFDRTNLNNGDKGLVEGYWRVKQRESSEYPWPARNDEPWPGKQDFLAKLQQKQNQAQSTNYRGMSPCRLHGLDECTLGERNGSAEYTYSAGGITVSWPQGYEHYIEVHNVKPCKAFYDFIIQN
jgi:hypothetical protein